jgi:hypothetical protein
MVKKGKSLPVSTIGQFQRRQQVKPQSLGMQPEFSPQKIISPFYALYGNKAAEKSSTLDELIAIIANP